MIRTGEALIALNYHRAQERLLFLQMCRGHRLQPIELPQPLVLSGPMVRA